MSGRNRGSSGRARPVRARASTPPPPPPSGSRVPKIAAAAVLGLLVIGLPAYLLTTGGTDPDPEARTQPSPPVEDPAPLPGTQPARALFRDTCGTCHDLQAAGTTGVFGPPLDGAQNLTAARVLNQIRVGSVSGAMPSNLLVGEDAERVARYVARVARGR